MSIGNNVLARRRFVMRPSILGDALNWQNLALGAAAVILAPAAIALMGSLMKPLAKAAIKGGLMVYETGRTVATETTEAFEELAAEAKSEIAQDKNSKIRFIKKQEAATQ
jgi:hypothetical protein